MLERVTDHSLEYKKRKAHLAIWFGLIAGLTFSIVLWGIDAVSLAGAHAISPWAKMLFGILPVVGICVLTAWISSRIDHGLVSLVLWLVCALVIGIFACHIPFEGLTFIYKLFNADVAAQIQYTFNSGVTARTVIVALICAVLGAMSGVFFGFLLENVHNSASVMGVIVSYVIWAAFFAGSASVVDQMIQLPLRSPVEAINNLIDQKLQSEITPISQEQARALHLSSLNGILDVVEQPRKLVLSNYDSVMIQTSVSIKFGSQWVECIVFADQSTEPPLQQPVYCKKTE